MPLEAMSEDDWLHTDVGGDNNFRWLNDIANLCHNTFVMSASSNRTAFVFFVCLSLFIPYLLMMNDK